MAVREIRPASIKDAEAIKRLSVQLGYNPSLDTVTAGLKAMFVRDDYEVVVITEHGDVVGWMSLGIRLRIEDESYFEVLAIVTEESKRGSGLGKSLIQYAEKRSRNHGLSLLMLYSNVIRLEDHKFYEKMGMLKHKQAYLLRKGIGN